MLITSSMRNGIAAAAVCVLALTANLASAQTAPTSNDATLEDRIAYRLETNEQLRRYDVQVDVTAGLVTLKGTVANGAQKAEAERVARLDNVTKIQNNIEINAKADETLTERTKSGLSKTGQKIDDAWITTKVKWFVMRDDVLDKSNINVDTRANVVTLRGTVPSEAGRTRAVSLAKQTEGVARVVDELTIAAARN
jgi:hyperosmotically inducible protein